MKNVTRHLLLLTLSCFASALIAQNSAQVVFYNEATDGALSGDFQNPSGPFTLNTGSNEIISEQGTSVGTADYFTVIIPDGLALSQLFLAAYDAAPGNQAFLGMQAGDSFTTDANTTQASDLLGGILYDESEIGDDMLPAIGSFSGAEGFTPPLMAGTYTFWLNQTGSESMPTLSFLVESETLGIPTPTNPQLEIYPNPATNAVFIKAGAQTLDMVRIVDLLGKVVFEDTNFVANTSIDLRRLKSGVYFVNIENGPDSSTLRLLVN